MFLTSQWQGLVSYDESLKLQEEAKKISIQEKKDFAIGFECKAVITLGLSGKVEEDVVASTKQLQDMSVIVKTIQRGGQATLHSEGQLVIYPVVNIRNNQLKVKDFINLIERITLKTLLHFGVETKREEKLAGLFTKKGKIAFFGIHVSEGISQHGLSINIKNDLNLFNLIRSCGTSSRIHDSLVSYCPQISLKEVFDAWINVAHKEGI